jgi:ureidoglycolate lyase
MIKFFGTAFNAKITKSGEKMNISSKDNQCGIDLNNPPSTRGENKKVIFDVDIVLATEDSLLGFGRPVTDFTTEQLDIVPFPLPIGSWRSLVPGTGIEGGYVEDVFECERIGNVQYSINVGLKRRYIIGWYGEDPCHAASPTSDPVLFPTYILTHEANYHPDGGQIISSRDGKSPFVLLLAPPGDTITPKSFKAFYIDPTTNVKGVHINPGTWHQPAFPVNGSGVLNNRQGKVHGCVAASFTQEFNGYLRVPLTLT